MRIEFDEASHTYRVDGVIWPSVTSVLRPLVDFSMVPADVMERAQQFGKAVHKTIELYQADDLDEASLVEPLKNVLRQYQKAVKAKKWTILGSEIRVAHPRLKYAGTLDLIAETAAGTQCLIDIKTGALPHTVGMQTAAYEAAHHAMHGGRAMKRYCLCLTQEDFKLVPLTDPADLSLFTSCLNIYKYLEKINGNRTAAA